MTSITPYLNSNSQRHIVMLVYPGCVLMDAAGPMEVFNFANMKLLNFDFKSIHKEPHYRLTVVAEKSGPVRTFSGVSIHADKAYEEIEETIDTLMIAGGVVMEEVINDSRMQNWVLSMLPKARRITSICTGAFVLAAGGILNNRRATTHWLYCENLASTYQQIRVEPDKIFYPRRQCVYLRRSNGRN